MNFVAHQGSKDSLKFTDSKLTLSMHQEFALRMMLIKPRWWKPLCLLYLGFSRFIKARYELDHSLHLIDLLNSGWTTKFKACYCWKFIFFSFILFHWLPHAFLLSETCEYCLYSTYVSLISPTHLPYPKILQHFEALESLLKTWSLWVWVWVCMQVHTCWVEECQRS